MRNIFITSDITPEQLERLAARCAVSRGGWGLSGVRLPPEELALLAQDAHILLVGYEIIDAAVIQELSQLELIACTRTNPVNIDLAAASARRIPVLHAPGRNTQTAAEYTLGLLLAAAHRIAISHHALRSGRYLGAPGADFGGADTTKDVIWKLDDVSPFKDFLGVNLSGRTLGIIGLGRIGSRVAQLARAFDMRVLAYSPFTPAANARQVGVELVDLDALLQAADFISLHAGVTPATMGLLGRRELALLKPSAYLINSSRAALIDQAALIDALQQGKIAGAALDVFWYEPLPSNHPLLQMENVTLTPHLAGAAADVRALHSQMIVDDILRWLDGETPVNVANEEGMGGRHSCFVDLIQL